MKFKAENISNECMRDLAAAICVQAALDYRKSIKGKWGIAIGRGEHKKYYQQEGGSVFLLRGKYGWHPATQEGIEPPYVYETFFNSDWFKMLSGIEDSKRVIMYLRSVKGRNMRVPWQG